MSSFVTQRHLLEEADHHEDSKTLPITALFVILALGLIGSLVPSLIAKRFPSYDLNIKPWFRFLNGLAAGLVLAVGYVHSLPEAFHSFGEVLTDDTPEHHYAWAGFIAMMGSLLTFAGEEFVHRRIGRFSSLHGGHGHSSHDGHDHHDHRLKPTHHDGHHAHSHAHALSDAKETQPVAVLAEKKEDALQAGVPVDGAAAPYKPPPSPAPDALPLAHQHDHEQEARDLKALEEAHGQKIGYYSELYVLLFGLSFHSIFVGLALGVVSDDWPLFIAILFHQFFEALALGARVARAQVRREEDYADRGKYSPFPDHHHIIF
eukprot:TRINITY_DN5690_c0_g1_i1.p1 TRINITY_DN5690_c0_g1~~TRINITY_DN5690_c0_g1_i1.p1  ORF type:complete len:362 (-),score=86.85 TRINITY_DN5690_c0_g1_i1:22-975(-)